jgi:CRP-like cAMP-binding protein
MPAMGAPAEDVRRPADLLSRIQLFTGLAPHYLKRIADIGVEESFRTGQAVFAEGSRGDKFYLILEGSVRISRNVSGMGEEALAVLKAGESFGEMSLIDDAPRSADAKVHEACKLLSIRKEDLEDLLFVDRDLAYELLWNLVRLLSARLRETNDKMTFLAVAGKF